MPKISTIIVSVFIISCLIVVGWLATVGTTKTVPDINPPVAEPSYTEPADEVMPPGAPAPTALPQDYVIFNITTRVYIANYGGYNGTYPAVEPPEGWIPTGEFTLLEGEVHQFTSVGNGTVETTQKLAIQGKGYAGLILRGSIYLNLTFSGPHGFHVDWQGWNNRSAFESEARASSQRWTTGRLFIFESGLYTMYAELGAAMYADVGSMEPLDPFTTVAANLYAFTVP